MKTTKEIADTVFRRRDAYFAQQRARNRTIRQAAVIGTSVCGCGILAFSGLHFRKMREPIPSITPAETTATQQTSITLMTTLTQTTQTTAQTVRHAETTQAATQSTTALTEGSSALQTTALTTALPVQTEPETTMQTQVTTQPIMTAETITYQTAAAGIVKPTPIVTETQPATTEPSTEMTEPVTETTAPFETRQLDGFRVEQYADCQKIICTEEFPAPDGELASYVVLSDEFTVLSMSEPEAPEPERSYEIECAEAGKVFTVTQREYAEFALTVEEGELIDISLNRAHGFFHLQGEICSLYWFRDGEGFFVSGDASDLKYLMAIARSFTPAGESK
ncbi:MAG: hypothetical protein K6F80_04420 [Oscillospiraceae bacterium]|nr:hypothetical protein [Oscillospiraceae bacterium]